MQSNIQNSNTQNRKRLSGSASQTKRLVWSLSLLAVAGAAVTVGVLRHGAGHAPAGRVYTRAGFGGYVGPVPAKQASTAANDPLHDLRDLYQAGNWTAVEDRAETLWQKQQFSADTAERKQAGQALLLAGYAAAWRKDFGLAGARFRRTQTLAGELPDRGAPPARLGEMQATLEEEAAFQHAVCAGATGDKRAAEGEYDDFMRQYPQSILVHAAVKRIARLHKDGDIPKDAESLWKQAMQQQKQVEESRRREQALCGPECLAHLLIRQGKTADVHALADEMKTGADGTSLQGLADAAKQHGFAPKGLALTPKGLAKQSLPLIVLLRAGHYVVAQAANADGVTVWNPDANGVGKAGVKTYNAQEWQQAWTGMALALTP